MLECFVGSRFHGKTKGESICLKLNMLLGFTFGQKKREGGACFQLTGKTRKVRKLRWLYLGFNRSHDTLKVSSNILSKKYCHNKSITSIFSQECKMFLWFRCLSVSVW